MANSPLVPTTPAQHDRRLAILRAAERRFAEGRFDKVHMEDVARDAGVGKGTLYRYFADKEALYVGVVLDGFEALQAKLRGTGRGAAPEARLEETVRAVVGFLGRNRFLFRLLGRDAGEASKRREVCQRWRRQRADLVDAVAEVLREGARSGAFDVAHRRTDAQMLLGMVRACLRSNDDGLSHEEIVDEVVRVFLHGIARTPNGIAPGCVEDAEIAAGGPAMNR